MSNNYLSFSASWLKYDKKEFRVLAMLADLGIFTGTLADICRYFSVSPQSKTKAPIRNSIAQLVNDNLITSELNGYTYTLSLNPTEREIPIDKELYDCLRLRQYDTKGIAWEEIVKSALWIEQNKGRVITNSMAAEELNISESTFSAAKGVLEREFSAIDKEIITVKISENEFRRTGQILDTSAWIEHNEK